jgi:TyrR family helix-turn-helix protein
LNNGNVINDEAIRQVLKKHGSSELSQGIYSAQQNTGDKQANCLAENSNNQSIFIAQASDWASAQATFEQALLQHFYPLYPTTRKLANRLKVSHNKIAMKLRQHQLK